MKYLSVKKGFIEAIVFGVLLLFSVSWVFSQSKRVIVVSDKATIHLGPNAETPILETVLKGSVLSLQSSIKIKRNWYYVLFTSEKGKTKSGYIQASSVEFTGLAPKIIREEMKKTLEKEKQVVKKNLRKVRVIVKNAGIRLRPDLESQVIQQVPVGAILQSIDKIKKWHRIDLPPDKDGIVVSGYIHESSVQEMQEEGQDEETKDEVEVEEEKPLAPPLEPEPAVVEEAEPQREIKVEPEAERERNISVKIGISYFSPSEQRCKDVYGSGMMYKGEVSIGIWRDLSLWISGGYLNKKGELFFTKEETKLKIMPFGAGVKYIFMREKVNTYSGIGLHYYQLEEKNPIGDVSKGGVGFNVEVGAFMLLWEGLMIDLGVDYSYCKMTPATRSINVGGFEVGIGVGYWF